MLCTNGCDDEEESCKDDCSEADLSCIYKYKEERESCYDGCYGDLDSKKTSDSESIEADGDGQAGGYIFYDDEADGVDDLLGYRFLEVVVEDLSDEVNYEFVWSLVEIDENGADRTLQPELIKVGDGIKNTQWIIANHTLSDYPAFQACVTYKGGGFTGACGSGLLIKRNYLLLQIR